MNKKNKTQKQISQTFELDSSRFWRKTSDEWRRRARRRQLHSRTRWFHRRRKVVKHKKKKLKKTEYEWKMFEGFANSRQMILSTSKFLKMSQEKKLSASTTQTVFQAFKKACSSSLRLARLSLFAARLTSKALQGRFGSKTTPHPSFFASTNIGYISNHVFNLVQSTWKFSLKRRKTPKNWILLVEKILVLFSIALIKFIYSFIHLLRTLNKVSRSHILRRNTLHCAL